MSRSFKKVPITGHAGQSEKKDKKRAHKAFRRVSKVKVNDFVKNIDFEGLMQESDMIWLPILMNDVEKNWTFTKDGKSYVTDLEYVEKVLRK